jgi:uncharacterized iron-regulated protein
MSRTTVITALVVLTLGLPGIGLAQDSSWKLAIGDPARKDREAPVTLDVITDTVANKSLTTGELGARLDDVRVLFIGESHTDMAFHRVQLQVIRELQQRGREIQIGLEMYPYTEQASSLSRSHAGTRTGATTGSITGTSSCSRVSTASRCTR